ncbi:SirB2 family protein [Paludibacterium purpuratum]|uniref:Putative membrane protein SirB2 n=1 Tax=Paludibacterium purpuratum TaxID=1144873 RepID=A0A4R7AUM0_9NEIS|nr:SirB2 family protein [Paludibacterium purpuratum]TDR70620.1 putative membrane protein SirB2 [Paludibacterium purpuratum]
MNYFIVKDLHIACVVLSVTLFALRGGLQLAGVAWRRWRLLRIAPHVVDSVLLGAAFWLASQLHQFPFVDGWLTAKFLALVAYVLLGKQALRPDVSPRRNLGFFLAALATVAYIVGVAVTHSPRLGG